VSSRLADMLLAGNTRFNMDLVANYIGSDQKRFDELISLMCNGADPLPQRSAWAMSVITDKEPGLMKLHESGLIDAMDTFKHTAMHRCVLRYLASVKISENNWGKLLDICYKYLIDNKMPPAIKVHAMQIIYNISEFEPDLKEELRLTIESIYDDGVPAIKSRGGKLLKKLSKNFK
jgi:hypothetical protein